MRLFCWRFRYKSGVFEVLHETGACRCPRLQYVVLLSDKVLRVCCESVPIGYISRGTDITLPRSNTYRARSGKLTGSSISCLLRHLMFSPFELVFDHDDPIVGSCVYTLELEYKYIHMFYNYQTTAEWRLNRYRLFPGEYIL